MQWVDGALARLRLLFARGAAESRMNQEFRFHIEMEAEQLIRTKGLTREEARRQALAAFGGTETHKEALRDGRGLTWFRGSSLDVKLGARMLVKYPGLTFAGGLALAIAIGIGAGWYDLSRQLLHPTLPLPEGERIVEITMRNSLLNTDESRLLHDFVSWRRDLRSIENLGAYRTFERNLIRVGALTEQVRVAEITASAFRLVRVPPHLGRPLLDADEQPGAPAVVVLGYQVWQRWFDGRADAIGQTVQLGRATTTVVGVMPKGFTFPVNHEVWLPLPIRPSGYAPLEGSAVGVFGRLARVLTHRQAAAELTALGERAAASSPQTHEHLRPELRPYGTERVGGLGTELALTHLPILLVLFIACTNVGTLIYARTATRDAEIVMRSALGASRRRIVAQLFVEALVLASVAAVVGLAAAHWVLKWGMAGLSSSVGGDLPFWIDPGLRLTTVPYAAGLTVVGAALLGVLPALRATGSQLQGQLRNLGAGGSTLRFGRVWTAAMIVQVTLTVICLTPAIGVTEEALRDRMIKERFPAEHYLAVRPQLDRETGSEESAASFAKRFEQTFGELERRVAQEPGVVAITFANGLPGMDTPVRRAEVETAAGVPPRSVPNLWTSTVGPGFFEAFDAPILFGRSFHEGDRATGARTVIVNEAFARRYMDGATPVGRRVRYAADSTGATEPWLEIVGMVGDIGMTPTDFGDAPYVFHAASLETVYPPVMGVRVAGDPIALAPRVRAIAAEINPDLRVDQPASLDELAWRLDIPALAIAGALIATVGLALCLSAAGIFSLMSVSVARRTREIGLRTALGASRARLLRGIFSRAVVIVGSGIACGNVVILLAVALAADSVSLPFVARTLAIPSIVMMTVALLACIAPARRALRIDPSQALKET